MRGRGLRLGGWDVVEMDERDERERRLEGGRGGRGGRREGRCGWELGLGGGVGNGNLVGLRRWLV